MGGETWPQGGRYGGRSGRGRGRGRSGGRGRGMQSDHHNVDNGMLSHVCSSCASPVCSSCTRGPMLVRGPMVPDRPHDVQSDHHNVDNCSLSPFRSVCTRGPMLVRWPMMVRNVIRSIIVMSCALCTLVRNGLSCARALYVDVECYQLRVLSLCWGGMLRAARARSCALTASGRKCASA